MTLAGNSLISFAVSGSGHGGDIAIQAGTLAEYGSLITTQTTGNGNAGNITLKAGDR